MSVCAGLGARVKLIHAGFGMHSLTHSDGERGRGEGGRPGGTRALLAGFTAERGGALAR